MIEKIETRGGLTVILDHMEEVSTCSIGVFVHTGSKNEDIKQHGISHVLEHMIFKGTEKRNYFEISEEIDFLGSSINAYTSKEETVFYVNALSDYLDETVHVLFDIVTNSIIDKEELEKEKDVIIEEIKMYEDTPDDVVFEYNSNDSIKGNLSRNVIGTRATVKGLTRENILKYYKNNYTKDNILIVISGNFNKSNFIKNVDLYFSKLQERRINDVQTLEFDFKKGKKEYTKDIKQVNICISTNSTSYLNQDRLYYEITSSILGGSMSSRLFQKIREEMGLAYSVYSFNQFYKEGGQLLTYIGTNKKNYKKAIKIVEEEYEKIREYGITENELQKQKNKYISKIAFTMETPRSRMSTFAFNYIRRNNIFDIEEFKKEVNEIEINNVNTFLRDKFKSVNTTILGNI